MVFSTLRRTDIDSLDEALYAASCFAGSAADGSRTVTILMSIEHGDKEVYRIEDGDVGPIPGNASTCNDWEPVYVVKASRRNDAR